MQKFIINRFKILIFKTWKHNKNNSMESTKNFIKSKDTLILEIQNNNYHSKRIKHFHTQNNRFYIFARPTILSDTERCLLNS